MSSRLMTLVLSLNQSRLGWACACLLEAGLILVSLAMAATAADAVEPETLPDGVQVVEITTIPEAIELQHRFAYRQLLILGRTAEGELVDLTRMAKRVAAPEAVQISPQGIVSAAKDGEGELRFEFGEHSIAVPVRVAGAATTPPVSFLQDVQPVLSKMGCNQGTCHGSKDGKGGFKLSLRGYDALYDHRALTDDFGARRFNRAAPDQSLMLLKATGSIPHVGGVRTTVDHPYYEIVRSWIANGCRLDLDAPKVASIEIFPKDPIVPRPNMKQQMSVVATFSDGTTRDVTREAFIESGNIEVIEADQTGLLTMLRRGEAPVLVRYQGAYAAATLTVMGDRSGFVWKQPETFNYVDELVYKKLKRVRVSPADLCGDAEFARRVYLDLTGIPPTPAQLKAFLDSSGDQRQRRDRLVDELIGSQPFIEHWTNKWADLLQVNRKFLGEEGAIALRNWIKQSVAENKPYDEFAREVLTAVGSNLDNPPASYYKVLRTPQDAMENTTHLFLAVRFNCNKCHDHPFERWTQDQYYELAAYFAQVGRKVDPAFRGQTLGRTAVESAKPLVEVIYDTGSGEIKHDRTGQVTAPEFPYAHDDMPAGGSRREQLADWMTSPKNQYFAKSYVNRLWGYLFGIGIIEPIDDIRAGNPPTNPELLDALTTHFIESGFDTREMLRTICKSRVYQHSIESNRWNEDDLINFSHAIPRRLPAEVLFDAIHVATGSQPKIAGIPAGFRAAQIPDAGVKVPFLDDFGRPVRESSCECERSSGMVLGPVMKLVNGPTVANAVTDANNEISRLVASTSDDRELVRKVFLRILCREPNEDEINLALAAMNAVGSEHAELLAELQSYEATIPARQAAWEKQAMTVTQWTVAEPTEMTSAVGGKFTKNDDQSVSVTGTLKKDVYTLKIPSGLPTVTGLRIEAMSDKSLPAGGPGRAQNGNFVLSELTVEATPADAKDQSEAMKLKLVNAQADFSQQGWPVANAVDGNPATGWAVSPQFNKTHTAIFEFAEPVKYGNSLLTIKMSQQFPDGAHLIGRLRVSLTHSPTPLREKELPAPLADALRTPAEKRTDAQKKVLSDHFRGLDNRLQQLTDAVARSAAQKEQRRLIGMQDLAWALINTPAFLFNR